MAVSWCVVVAHFKLTHSRALPLPCCCRLQCQCPFTRGPWGVLDDHEVCVHLPAGGFSRAPDHQPDPAYGTWQNLLRGELNFSYELS